MLSQRTIKLLRLQALYSRRASSRTLTPSKSSRQPTRTVYSPNLLTTIVAGSTADLNKFILITFADLKKYKYYYWFAFPAFVSKPLWQVDHDWDTATKSFTHEQLSEIQAWTRSNQSLPYFLVRSSSPDTLEFSPIEDFVSFFANVPPTARTIAFVDPSASPSSPGWPLRNLLAFLHHRHPEAVKDGLQILCWRDLDVVSEGGSWKSRIGTVRLGAPGEDIPLLKDKPSAVGWEKNPQGKLGPRLADLAPMMDPTRLANQAVDLNLKLMRWRILPSLDLDKVASTRCLLLGAGTLGCYVARTLMGWGVRKITFVDSARVSFSNPVRQPLFEFEDCLNGGQPKAACAASRLKKIFPGIDATGHELSIPMPGHPVPPASLEQVKKDVAKLEELFDDHDVVFLLMDSRESRWLPTVIGASKGKIVMNAALGFDSYLVMRHGARSTFAKGDTRLGCYYCNDIVAPADSLSDRTLDQMCTVTRPGLASIASSTAVELLVSMLQHPDGINAPAPPAAGKDLPDPSTSGSVLGLIPHQLRGFLAEFRTMHIVGAAYSRCTGCSEIVIKEYETKGFDMLLRAFNETGYLETLTGLDKLHEEGEKALEGVDWDVDGSDDGDDF